MDKHPLIIFWFRRDLRFDDNTALIQALCRTDKVLPIFIFDEYILQDLEQDDPRVNFIYQNLAELHQRLAKQGSGIHCLKGQVLDVWGKLLQQFEIRGVFWNEDYEPYALHRDQQITELLTQHQIPVETYKDQVIFAKDEILKQDETPYVVFSPYKKQWVKKYQTLNHPTNTPMKWDHFVKSDTPFPSLKELGFKVSSIEVPPYSLEHLADYKDIRNIPSLDQTSHLSVHLRFGTVSIRTLIQESEPYTPFFNELIWREFFMQMLYHFPKTITDNFKPQYDALRWRNNEKEFECWKMGMTGYPMVDAGMRELNATGYISNRMRLIVADFLCKHLLIDWRWGEAYFAQKLLDYELSSNIGNWQWCAGTGCDAAPYFRFFNPDFQAKKFDPQQTYIHRWIPIEEKHYPARIVEHEFAKARALEWYGQIT